MAPPVNNSIIAVDFDGTIVTHEFPLVGRPVPSAIKVLRRLIDNGTKLILWTMRSGRSLDDAVAYCVTNNIDLWAVNENPSQSVWTSSPKAYAPIYIDDAALGCPLLWDEQSQRNMVNWREVETILERIGVLIPK